VVEAGQLGRSKTTSVAAEPRLRQGRKIVAVDGGVAIEALLGPTGTSVGSPLVPVIPATVTAVRSRINVSRETTAAGRRPPTGRSAS
jgi:hypothetical protein